MTPPTPRLLLRYMTMQDIPQVVEIDEMAFSTPWSARSYRYEIAEAPHSHMLVLEQVATPAKRPPSRWRRWWRWFFNGQSPAPTADLVAYGGLWRILEEAHISTIATHIEHRGRGYGEVALLAMLRRAITLGAEYVVLEVRVSNKVAQRLYEKHGFTVLTVKKRYYRDNGEDAYDMRLPLTPATCAQIEARYQAACARHGVADAYSAHPVPQDQAG